VTRVARRIDLNCTENYIIEYTWTAADVCGNFIQHKQNITSLDRTPPVLVGVPYDTAAEYREHIPPAEQVSATDGCSKDAAVFSEDQETHLLKSANALATTPSREPTPLSMLVV